MRARRWLGDFVLLRHFSLPPVRRWLRNSCHWVQSVTCRRWNAQVKVDISLTWAVIGTQHNSGMRDWQTHNTRLRWVFNWTTADEQMNWNGILLAVGAEENYWDQYRSTVSQKGQKKTNDRRRKWKWTAKSHPFCEMVQYFAVSVCVYWILSHYSLRTTVLSLATANVTQSVDEFFPFFSFFSNGWIAMLSNVISFNSDQFNSNELTIHVNEYIQRKSIAKIDYENEKRRK